MNQKLLSLCVASSLGLMVGATAIPIMAKEVFQAWSVGDIGDKGYSHLPRFIVDVNNDGYADYCRFVGDEPKIFLSCQLGTRDGLKTSYTYNSIKGIDKGYNALPRWMADVNGDGYLDYCRFVGDNPNVFLSCNLGNRKGFDSNQYTYNSVKGIDKGYGNMSRSLADRNGDGRADFCRHVGNSPNIFLSCNLARKKGFDANQYTLDFR